MSAMDAYSSPHVVGMPSIRFVDLVKLGPSR